MSANIRLSIHSDTNEMALAVLSEWAIIRRFSEGTVVELPAGTELLAHEEDTTNMSQTSCTLTAILYKLPCGLKFGYLQKTIGEFGTYRTVDKIDIHINTI